MTIFKSVKQKDMDANIEEIWKDITGFEGFYQVSNLGFVRRLPGIVKSPIRPQGMPKKGRIMKTFIPIEGYKKLSLCVNGIMSTHYVHVLVARAFKTNPKNLPQVNHLDFDKLNNAEWNLEWVSGPQNIRHAIKAGRVKTTPPEKLVTRSKIHTMIQLNQYGYTQADLAKIFKLSTSCVSRIVKCRENYGKILDGTLV